MRAEAAVNSTEDIINQLPGDLRHLAEVLREHFPDAPYIAIVLRIAKEFRGTYIRVHSLDDLEREIRNTEIRAEYTSGKKAPQLAIKFRLTERHIWNILGTEPDAPAPAPLLSLIKNQND